MKEVAKSEVIVGELQKVFDTDQSRTKMGRLREMFDAIEKKREGGMSLEKIRLVLEENGFVIRLPTLTQYLHRIRQERGLESVSDQVPVAESKTKPERPKGPKAARPGKGKGQDKSPAAPDVLDVGKQENAGQTVEQSSTVRKAKTAALAEQFIKSGSSGSSNFLDDIINKGKSK